MQNEETKPAPTHVLLNFEGNVQMLFRADDGVCVGMQKQETIVFGEEPNRRSSRTFIDVEHAQKWLRTECAARDLKVQEKTGEPIIEERQKFDKIVLPAGVMDIPSGGVHPMRKTN